MLELVIPAFIAGILTFLAPCTLPLVPAYLSFIGGTSAKDATELGSREMRKRVLRNGIFFVLGFSIVFIILGVFASTIGSFVGASRIWVSRIGGVLIILFGLMMLNALKIPHLSMEHRPAWANKVKPGSYGKSMLIGVIFGSGWTPCIGPILGSILVLAGTGTTALEGAILLAVFSFGLAIPFLAVAVGIGKAQEKIDKYASYFKWVSRIGGVFLIGLGVLLFTDNMSLLISYGYRIFGFINYERLLNYL